MCSKSFTSVGPGKALAYVRDDLQSASKSFFLVGPWLDDYVAREMVLVASRNLRARILVRPERQVEPDVWNRMVAALSAFADHWSNFEARSLDRLHAKCLLLDEQVAYVGSANWYRYSLEESLEIVLRGPVADIVGLQQDLESLWEEAQPLVIPARPPGLPRVPAGGITHEVLDPIAAQVLKENSKAFVLGRKKSSVS